MKGRIRGWIYDTVTAVIMIGALYMSVIIAWAFSP